MAPTKNTATKVCTHGNVHHTSAVVCCLDCGRLLRPFTVVGLWEDDDGGGEFTDAALAIDRADAIVQVKATLDGEHGDGYSDELRVVEVFAGDCEVAR